MKKMTFKQAWFIVAMVLLTVALTVSAQAADKLVVKDANGVNTVFRVQDNGTVEVPGGVKWDNSLKRLGIATTNPQSSLHLVENSTSGSRGLICGQHNTGPQAGVMVFRKSRGTETAPAAVAEGDYIATIHAQAYDGTQYLSNVSTGSISFLVDGPVATGSIPTGMSFQTGSTVTNKSERLKITSAGNVGIGTSTPTELLDVNSDGIRIRTAKTPTSSNAACNQGEMSWDSNFVYVCVATNTWKRSALASW